MIKIKLNILLSAFSMSQNLINILALKTIIICCLHGANVPELPSIIYKLSPVISDVNGDSFLTEHRQIIDLGVNFHGHSLQFLIETICIEL